MMCVHIHQFISGTHITRLCPGHIRFPRSPATTTTACTDAGNSNCKIACERVGIYIGGSSITRGGIDDSSKMWAQALAAFWQTGAQGPPGSGYENVQLNAGGGASYNGDASATYVTLTLSELQDCYGGELNNLELLVMPGGSAYEIQDALGAAGKAAIRSYLDNGGNYLGFCAGGYYIAKGYYWKGERFLSFIDSTL